MPITVIISHFNPDENRDSSFQWLINTIDSVRNQTGNDEVEIIICDDGSICNKNYFPDNDISIYTKNDFSIFPEFFDLEFDYYIYHHTDRYQRAKLWEKAIEISHNENLIFLDEDTPLLKRNSLQRYELYFLKYIYIKGRIIKNNGIHGLFSHLGHQGSNFGIKKSLFKSIRGFSNFIYEDSFGDDDDLTYKVYKYISTNKEGHKACYGGDIIVQNSVQGRWHSGKDDNHNRGEIFAKNFEKQHGVKDSYSLGSRNKKLWLEFPTWRVRLSEVYHIIFNYILKQISFFRSVFRFKQR
tara:strand:+ start:298 stop:1188 length:891 start_codon:yes stop_codon:yes gene_type:complete